MHVCVRIHIHTQSSFFNNYIVLLDIWRFCFSQCLWPVNFRESSFVSKGCRKMKVVWPCREEYFITEIV